MLRRITIDNFKSLMDFHFPSEDEAPLDKMVCIVGLNGSGKSTLLQALDFLRQLTVGGMSEWLKARDWTRADLSNKGRRRNVITFQIEMESVFGELTWGGTFNTQLLRCTSESLQIKPGEEVGSFIKPEIIKLDSGEISISSTNRKIPVTFKYEGSVFSQFQADSVSGNASLAKILLEISLDGIKSLELLSPNLMRKPSRDAVDIGVGGEHLAAFINGLSSTSKKDLTEKLKIFYPKISKISSRSTKYGWRRLYVTEDYGDGMETEARHVNDGLLRLLSILAQTIAEPGIAKQMRSKSLSEAEQNDLGSLTHKFYELILLDEIENGINPELMDKLVNYLLNVKQQVILTTHSPMLLNYLPDDVAANSVFFLFRDMGGAVRCRRLFSIARMRKKLEVMGPGEAFADTGLELLSSDLASEQVATLKDE